MMDDKAGVDSDIELDRGIVGRFDWLGPGHSGVDVRFVVVRFEEGRSSSFSLSCAVLLSRAVRTKNLSMLISIL